MVAISKEEILLFLAFSAEIESRQIHFTKLNSETTSIKVFQLAKETNRVTFKNKTQFITAGVAHPKQMLV